MDFPGTVQSSGDRGDFSRRREYWIRMVERHVGRWWRGGMSDVALEAWVNAQRDIHPENKRPTMEEREQYIIDNAPGFSQEQYDKFPSRFPSDIYPYSTKLSLADWVEFKNTWLRDRDDKTARMILLARTEATANNRFDDNLLSEFKVS